MQKKVTLEDFWVGPAECAASRGEKKRGVQEAQEARRYKKKLEDNRFGQELEIQV